MKTIIISTITLLLIWANGVDGQTQDQTPSNVRASWLQLARTISDPKMTGPELIEASNTLHKLPNKEIIKALEYIIENKELSAGWAEELIAFRPNNETALIIARKFGDWNAEEQAYLLRRSVYRIIILNPNADNFKMLPRLILRNAAVRKLTLRQIYNLDIASLLLSIRPESSDYNLMHQALVRNRQSTGTWCALMQAGKLSKGEVAVADRTWTSYSGRTKLVLAGASLNSSHVARRYFTNEVKKSLTFLNAARPSTLSSARSGLIVEQTKNLMSNLNVVSILMYVDKEKARPFMKALSTSGNAYVRQLFTRILCQRFAREYVANYSKESNDSLSRREIVFASLKFPIIRKKAQVNLGNEIYHTTLLSVKRNVPPLMFPRDWGR
jgi:hypothetical protein